MRRSGLVLLCALALVLSSCALFKEEKEAPVLLVLKPAAFRDLPGWDRDDQAAAMAAFKKSCTRILKKDPAAAFGPIGGIYAQWQPLCDQAQGLPDQNPDQARRFFEQNFTPWLATADGREEEGLFTGYYEASLRGSRTRQGPYQTPLHLRPDDLVMVDLGEFREELKGQRIAGRVKSGHLKPYEDRAAIVAGKMPRSEELSLIWVDDPVDAFFLHIQGSGHVDLDDGTALRVGYDGQNGYPYYAIGRELVKREIMSKDEVSMQTIRQWLEAHPDQAQDFMNLNKSYIFFRALEEDSPLGGEGVPLTAGRSLAIDRTKLAYGLPLWVDIKEPAAGVGKLQRLMVAQDTGGAITGAVRGDFFWGYGPQAEEVAGVMKAQGRYWVLLPRGVMPIVAAASSR